MTLSIRIIAGLTVLLSLALMAVSAYAAKNGVELSYPGVRDAPERQSVVAGASIDGPSEEPPEQAAPEQPTPTLAATVGLSPTATVVARSVGGPRSTVVPRYAAPLGAGQAVRLGGGSRGDLSAGPRVWRVPSIRPRVAPILELPSGGLGIPPEQLAVMQQVGVSTGLPWQILAAIARVESSFGSNMETSSAGAIGYGQFLPEMWDVYGNGGDPYDFHDALPAMGRYLLGAGALDDLEGAIFSYNHSVEYVAGVLSIAAAYGYQSPQTGVPLTPGGGLIWPVIGPISSYFTPDHQAIDVGQAAVPGAPVRAAHSGVVLFAGGDPCCSYGFYVMVVGPSSITTLYAHLDMLAVTPGQTVLQGQSLGAVGCTGNCTGPHLHFEILEGGVRRNPLDYLP